MCNSTLAKCANTYSNVLLLLYNKCFICVYYTSLLNRMINHTIKEVLCASWCLILLYLSLNTCRWPYLQSWVLGIEGGIGIVCTPYLISYMTYDIRWHTFTLKLILTLENNFPLLFIWKYMFYTFLNKCYKQKIRHCNLAFPLKY